MTILRVGFFYCISLFSCLLLYIIILYSVSADALKLMMENTEEFKNLLVKEITNQGLGKDYWFIGFKQSKKVWGI